MSDADQNDDDRSFLARWSQRKQEAKQPEPKPEPKPEAPAAEAEIPPAAVADTEAAAEFDLSSLPKLEEMTGTTDITGFLRKGVPEHLRNAALRQSWALDPAIRNYVNPALEYAYDWNTPGGVPGSSEIGAGMDVARLVSQIMGGATEEPPAAAVDAAEAPAENPAPLQHAAQEPAPDLSTETLRLTEAGHPAAPPANADDAGGPEAGRNATSVDNSAASQHPVRRHGTAKPIV